MQIFLVCKTEQLALRTERNCFKTEPAAPKTERKRLKTGPPAFLAESKIIQGKFIMIVGLKKIYDEVKGDV